MARSDDPETVNGGGCDGDPVILALTTEADPGRAEALAQVLLERQLAACVTMQPMTSLYRWQGRVERSQEVQLLIKSRASLLAALEAAVHGLHSYSVPAWLHWPVVSSAPYAAWLHESCLRERLPDGSGPADAGRPGGEDPAG